MSLRRTGWWLVALMLTVRAGAADRPDVLFIAVDDLNDWVLQPDSPIQAPNIQRLAARGTLFTRAYCASPACNPSRTSVMTGLRASSTGVYGNKTDWRRALPDAVTLSRHFMNSGYRAEGAGKIFHHHYGSAFHDRAGFDDFQLMPDPPDAPMPPTRLNGLATYGSENTDWGAWPPNEADAVDVRTVNYCLEKLKAARTKPLFLAAGIFRPHMPFFAPQRWLDLYPADKVTMPTVLDTDRDDLPPGAIKLLKPTDWFFDGLRGAEAAAPGTWREAVRCYQAAASFADAQIGRLLDGLDAAGRAERTVIVLWSDHGYHLGEKDHWEKFALWEKTTHVPLIIVAPGVTKPGMRCERTVSLLDIYPTLIELCGLPARSELEGRSLVPLLRDPQQAWQPAVMTYERGNHAVRSERWRYIRYADGSQELYDETADPNEWHNLAAEPGHEAVIAELARWLPRTDAPPAKDMKKPK